MFNLSTAIFISISNSDKATLPTSIDKFPWYSLISSNFSHLTFVFDLLCKEPGTIVQEIQKGFTIKNRLLRPSLVGVSKKMAQVGKKDDKNEENLEQK